MPWTGKGTDPYVLAKSAESHDSKGLPERCSAEEGAKVRKSPILKGRKKHTRALIGKRTPKPVKGKRVEFRLMEKWTSEFRPHRQAKDPHLLLIISIAWDNRKSNEKRILTQFPGAR